MTIIPPATTPLDHLRDALQHGSMPNDLITPLRDLLDQLDFATGAADRAAARYPDAAEVAKRSAYRAGTLDMVLDACARLLAADTTG